MPIFGKKYSNKETALLHLLTMSDIVKPHSLVQVARRVLSSTMPMTYVLYPFTIVVRFGIISVVQNTL